MGEGVKGLTFTLRSTPFNVAPSPLSSLVKVVGDGGGVAVKKIRGVKMRGEGAKEAEFTLSRPTPVQW